MKEKKAVKEIAEEEKNKDEDDEYVKESCVIRCHDCGCTFIDEMEWIMNNGRTECPMCEAIFKIN